MRAGADGRMPEWLAQRAALTPDRPAVLAEDGTWTFAELDRRAWAAARRLALLRQDTRPGEPVALLARNSAAYVQAVHGIARAGRVLVPLNVRLAAPELAWQLRDAGARLLLHDAEHAGLAAAAADQAPGTVPVPLAEVAVPPDGTAAEPPGRVDLSAAHSIIYTSGTTGRPKGAVLTYGNHLWSALGSCLNLGLHTGDRWLACLPLFHVGGLSILLRSVLYGIPAVVHGAFDPAAVNRAIDRDGVTIISVVSVMLQRMLEERGARPYPAWLRCVLAGGGPVPEDLLRACAERGVPVVQTYGLTEAASQVATLAPEDALRKLGSAGKPLLPTEVRVVDGEGRPLPPEAPGEILVRGPTVMAGYHGRPEETAAVLRDGWLHTGDVGYLDAEGYLYVLDRRSDLIISGGENVYPAEVEAALREHPDVADAGVFGVADPRWGQAVAAAVVRRPGAGVTEEALRAFCRERLAPYKVPRHVHFVAALPRNAAGKLLRQALRRQYAGPDAAP
ncbi:MAG TPA: o-succinylbenzoate--CoA ligase [Dehalococcoidia bacterium]